MEEKRTCKVCGKSKDIKCFAVAGKNPKYRKWTCHACRTKAQLKRKPLAKEKAREYQRRWAARHPENVILQSSRQSDRKKGFENDMDAAFIKELIGNPCTYCEGTRVKMSLDRVDNSLGHLKTNVVHACIRCNYTRGSMPHEAWLLLAPAMREAREQGLFGNWEGRAGKEHWKKK